MINNEIHQRLEPSFMKPINESLHISHGSILGVNGAMVRNIVAHVHLERLVYRTYM